MRAAVVASFDDPPSYRSFAEPRADDVDEAVIEVLAAGLHPRVRSQANGSHYTSTSELPIVPGIDGVGRLPNGELRYFVLPDTTLGSMAERTVIDLRRSVVLPSGADPVRVAAAMNPAMSSWVALRRRIELAPGASVLVVGATGSAGRMAVQVCRLLGAAHVVAVGRDPQRLAMLPALGAHEVVSLQGDDHDVAGRLGAAAQDVDVVIDYLWGPPAAAAMLAIAMSRPDPSRPLAWIQIGSVAGAVAEIPSALLRACRLQIVGSGQGSVSTRDILDELPALVSHITDGSLDVSARAVPLRDVERVWREPANGDERLVLTP